MANAKTKVTKTYLVVINIDFVIFQLYQFCHGVSSLFIKHINSEAIQHVNLKQEHACWFHVVFSEAKRKNRLESASSIFSNLFNLSLIGEFFKTIFPLLKILFRKFLWESVCLLAPFLIVRKKRNCSEFLT